MQFFKLVCPHCDNPSGRPADFFLRRVRMQRVRIYLVVASKHAIDPNGGDPVAEVPARPTSASARNTPLPRVVPLRFFRFWRARAAFRPIG